MRIKQLIAMVSTVCIASHATAGFEQFAGPNGSMNVFELLPSGEGPAGYLFSSGWGLVDVQSLTTDDRTFELLPNINTYRDNPDNAYWRNNGGAGPDGNKWMEAFTLFEIPDMPGDVESATLVFNVDEYTLDDRYTVTAFVKVLNSLDGSFSTIVFTETELTGTASNLTLNLNVAGQAGQLLQAGWVMEGINANPADDWGSVTVTATDLFADTGDVSPPSPNPMTFASEPMAISDQAITMTATTATDESDVQYYFTCVSGGGNDSGWQSETTYVDAGLDPNTQYSYTVQARDLSANQNSNTVSGVFAATTNPTDTTPPSPNPEIIGVEPSAISVLVTATTVTDDSAVEYYFANTITGNDSGWQSSPVYADTGLAPGAAYAYTVQARDLSAATNTTPVSSAVAVTTWSSERSANLADSLQTYSGDSLQGTTIHDLAIEGWQIASDLEGKLITFDSTGATFGSGPTYENRNTLRTLYEDYGDYDFEAYATFITQNTAEQAGFIGVGHGIVGGFGVPDFELAGVNAINAEMQGNWCKVFTHIDGVIDNVDETAGLTTSTNRVKMVHDATAETITFSMDTDYAGGAFVEDRVLGTASTVGVWVDAPQRVYIAAGAGVTFKDFEVMSDAPAIPITLAIDIDGTDKVLEWQGVPGQVYEVQYKTDLVTGSWTADPTIDIISDMGGSMSATSTVNEASAFYRFILQ